jgi:hypothetical protein
VEKNGKCSRCKRRTTVNRYQMRNQWGDLFNRWLCRMCAISRGLVLAYGGN